MQTPLAFEAGYAPMFAALNNYPGAAAALTPELLAKAVSDAISQAIGQAVAQAITQAIAGCQVANNLVPAHAVQANLESVATSAANDSRARSTEGPVVVHGDTAVLAQLRREMGLDDFVFADSVSQGAAPGMPAHVNAVEEDASVWASIRSADVSERKPAELLPGWTEDLKWLAAELGNVRAPETVAPEWARDPGTSPDSLSPWALPARLGACLEACDIRPRLASVAADTTAWLRAGTSQLFDPFRVGEVRGRTWVVLLIGASALLRAIVKG